ncbi:DUF3973 domain-containing protein [Paenibacillus sp. MZ04-78.2]|uniref:DUF3973 domain-containing protein n=1 Tax=Paenibacillus sp. MZ04-78.2 TaxID=2962034 RepID=UPI0035C9A089
MYYCLACQKLHKPNPLIKCVVFKTGFHFINSMKYNAGICQAVSDSKENVSISPVSA